jgi:tetratricopeptide (TPR) repeat protein
MNTKVIPSALFIVLSIVCSSCSQPDDTATEDKLGTDAQLIEALTPLQSREAAKDPGSPDGPKPTSATEYINLSLQHYNDREWEKTIQACIEALNYNPSYALAYNNICAAYLQLEDFDRAILACNKALALQPDFPLARNNLSAATNKKEGN